MSVSLLNLFLTTIMLLPNFDCQEFMRIPTSSPPTSLPITDVDRKQIEQIIDSITSILAPQNQNQPSLDRFRPFDQQLISRLPNQVSTPQINPPIFPFALNQQLLNNLQTILAIPKGPQQSFLSPIPSFSINSQNFIPQTTPFMVNQGYQSNPTPNLAVSGQNNQIFSSLMPLISQIDTINPTDINSLISNSGLHGDSLMSALLSIYQYLQQSQLAKTVQPNKDNDLGIVHLLSLMNHDGFKKDPSSFLLPLLVHQNDKNADYSNLNGLMSILLLKNKENKENEESEQKKNSMMNQIMMWDMLKNMNQQPSTTYETSKILKKRKKRSRRRHRKSKVLKKSISSSNKATSQNATQVVKKTSGFKKDVDVDILTSLYNLSGVIKLFGKYLNNFGGPESGGPYIQPYIMNMPGYGGYGIYKKK